MRFAAGAALLTATLCGSSASAQQVTWQDVDHLFHAYADSDKAVGTSLLYMKNGKVVQRHDYGYADRASAKPIDDQSIYHWGSITKTLTAISIVRSRQAVAR